MTKVLRKTFQVQEWFYSYIQILDLNVITFTKPCLKISFFMSTGNFDMTILGRDQLLATIVYILKRMSHKACTEK